MDRFWSKVEKTDGCWHWTSTMTEKGYGRFRVGTKNIRAHRLSYEMTRGAIPEGMHVLHKCDNPGCVNPHHLFLGTNADNMADKCTKGREAHYGHKGEKNSKAKLVSSQAMMIRKLPGTSNEMASLFGISRRAVEDIRSGRCWSHI